MQGRVVLVTGSTRGIGLELARACAARGARVIVHGRDRARVEQIASELGSFGIAIDLAEPEALIRRAIENCGRIDVLVNNAGISGPRAPLWEAPIGDVLATNLVAAMRCTRELLAWAVPRDHAVRIVNVSSGITGAPRANAAEYIASKAALDAFTRALALDLEDTSSVVTAVALGGYATDLTRGFERNADEQSAMAVDRAREHPAGTHTHGASESPPGGTRAHGPASVREQPGTRAHGPASVETVREEPGARAHGPAAESPPGGTRAHVGSAAVDGSLPPARAAVPHLIRAIEAPAHEVHGRVLEPPVPPLDRDRVDLFAHPLGPSPRAIAALAQTEHVDRYPDTACPALRKVLAARLGVALDTVVVGAGISELLERVLRVATRPGETVIANAPSWPLVPYACRARGVAWRQVPYRIANGRADHDLDAILAAIDRGVRLVYLTSPANPGGAAIDAGELERFVAAVPRHVTVVVDEAYLEYATRGDAANAANLVRWIDAPLVALRSFSKFYGLAGLRIGYAVATNPLAGELARAAPPFAIARGAEAAAIAALGDHEHAQRVTRSIAAARAQLERELDERGIERLASDGPFVLAADPLARGPHLFDRFAMVPIHEVRRG